MATAPVSHEPSEGFPPKGSLRKVPFPRLIREVARRKLDGSLYLLSDQTKKVVFFQGGHPVFVRSNVLSECLGQILAQEGLITSEQCEQTLEAIRRTGKKQGELLVEMGILSEGNLRYGLEAQLRAKLFDIFSWEQGRYQFKGEPPELQFGITLKASAEGVIVEAIQDQYTEERAREVLEAVAGKHPTLRADAAAAAELRLLPEEEHFLACLDGSRSMQELIDEPPDDLPVPTPMALLAGLLLAGLLDLSDTPMPRTAWPPPPDLTAAADADETLRPPYEAQALITEYEDTPLPGEMPQSPQLLGDHEDGFEGVEDSAVVQLGSVMRGTQDVAKDLVEAEPASIDETFDELDMVDDVGSVEAASLDGPPLLDAPSPAIDDDFSLDFEDDQPSAIEAAEAAAAAAAAAAAEAAEPAPLEPAPLEPAPLAAEPSEPVPLAEPSEPAPLAAELPALEDDLLDLAPDDDLLMADESIEAAALDLLGTGGAAAGPAPDLAPADPDADADMAALESIEPLPLDGGSLEANAADFEAEELDDDVVEELDADELELDELDDDDDDQAYDEPEEPAPAPAAARSTPAGDLLDFDDLDDIDLDADLPGASRDDLPVEEDLGTGVEGALRYDEGQAAVAEERWSDAVTLLEQAYEAGFDVAELHAMLAYARFQAAGGDSQTAEHAFELLDYAGQMDPSLDLVHAYRGAILHTQGNVDQARESIDRALELNPYCELAMEIMDAIG